MRIVVDQGWVEFTNETSKTVSISDPNAHGAVVGLSFTVSPPLVQGVNNYLQQNVVVNGSYSSGTITIKASAPLTNYVHWKMVSMIFR